MTEPRQQLEIIDDDDREVVVVNENEKLPILEGRNPAFEMNPSGWKTNLDKEEVRQSLIEVEEAGYEIPVPRNAFVTEEVNLESVLQVIDGIVAHALGTYPNLFTVDDDVDDVQITPIELKAYLVVLFLNRMRSVNLLTLGDGVNIPWIAEDAPMPRAMFEMLSVLAPYQSDFEHGILTMDYGVEFSITNECIIGDAYVETLLNTPALLSLRGPDATRVGIHCLRKDPTTGEVYVVESSTIASISLSAFIAAMDMDRITYAIKQIYEITFTYEQLPVTAVSADFFACSRGEDIDGRPANQLMNPFSNYDEFHASVFCFFKRCHILATMNQKPLFQSPTRPNDNTTGAQYPKEFIVGVFVSAAYRCRDEAPQYLGNRKFYALDGIPVRPSPMFKSVDPMIIKKQVVDVVRSQTAALSQALKALNDPSGLANPRYNSPRFYREASLCLLSAVFKAVQQNTLFFMRNVSQICLYNQARHIQVLGAVALIMKELAPIVNNGNIILPFFEFGNLSLSEAWFEMDYDPTAPIDPLQINHMYPRTLTWSALAAGDAEYKVHFGDQIVDDAWITAYQAIPGWRMYPAYALNCAQNYEKLLEAFSISQGMWLSVEPCKVGGGMMCTYTKYVLDVDQKTELPVFDTTNSPSEIPSPFDFLLTIERTLYTSFLFGVPFDMSVICFLSVDILLDNSDDLNEFVFSSPLSTLPGTQPGYSMLNSDVSNSNGVITKAYGANVSAVHGEPEQMVLGVLVAPKNETEQCFWDAITSAVSSIGDALITGVNTFVDTGNPVAAGVSAVTQVVDNLFTADSRAFYQGSPQLNLRQVRELSTTVTPYSRVLTYDKTSKGKSASRKAAPKKQLNPTRRSRTQSRNYPLDSKKTAPVKKTQKKKLVSKNNKAPAVKPRNNKPKRQIPAPKVARKKTPSPSPLTASFKRQQRQPKPYS